MKKHHSAIICSIILLQVLLGGCTQKHEITPEAPKNDLKDGPSKIEYSFDGFEAELDGDNIVIHEQGMLKLFDLNNNKIIKEIPVSKENLKYGKIM